MKRQSTNGSERSTEGFRTLPMRGLLCAELCALGVKASMAERGRPEEKTGRGSLGIIDVAGSPIKWINVRWLVDIVDFSGSVQIIDYGVPDGRHLPQVEIRSNWVRAFPAFWRASGVKWGGDDKGMGIIQLLSNDETIRNAIMGTGLVTVRACPEYGCWLIVQVRSSTGYPKLQGYQWRCYEKIAENLLATPIPP